MELSNYISPKYLLNTVHSQIAIKPNKISFDLSLFDSVSKTNLSRRGKILIAAAVLALVALITLAVRKVFEKEPPPPKPKKNKGNVTFGDVKAREFYLNDRPEVVQLNDSVQLNRVDDNLKAKPTKKPLFKMKLPPGCTSLLFEEDDIIRISNVSKREQIDKKSFSPITVEYSNHDKAVIQQQTKSGSSAAVATMLIMDHEKEPDCYCLRSRTMTTVAQIIAEIQKSGLTTKSTNVPFSDLTQLRAAIEKDGSAIVAINGIEEIQYIIVDEISDDYEQVRIRDPYHGWEILITAEAFIKKFKIGDNLPPNILIIQAYSGGV